MRVVPAQQGCSLHQLLIQELKLHTSSVQYRVLVALERTALELRNATWIAHPSVEALARRFARDTAAPHTRAATHLEKTFQLRDFVVDTARAALLTQVVRLIGHPATAKEQQGGG